MWPSVAPAELRGELAQLDATVRQARTIGVHGDKTAIDDLARVLEGGAPIERQAAALALGESSLAEAARILERDNALAAEVHRGQISWSSLAATSFAKLKE
jgi:HEAT repeat protein